MDDCRGAFNLQKTHPYAEKEAKLAHVSSSVIERMSGNLWVPH